MAPSPAFDELLKAARHSAVHLEMRDGYMLSDPAYQDWASGKRFDPAERWPGWLDLVRPAVARGVAVRRARIVSEPISDYVRYEYDVTEGLNIAAGEEVRWLPRAQATDIALPGNDFWLFDDYLLQINHFAGNGEATSKEMVDDPATVMLCMTAFEAVWERAVPHAEYQPT